jgi:hypothetical protein
MNQPNQKRRQVALQPELIQRAMTAQPHQHKQQNRQRVNRHPAPTHSMRIPYCVFEDFGDFGRLKAREVDAEASSLAHRRAYLNISA